MSAAEKKKLARRANPQQSGQRQLTPARQRSYLKTAIALNPAMQSLIL
jgi:hypothetical protein